MKILSCRQALLQIKLLISICNSFKIAAENQKKTIDMTERLNRFREKSRCLTVESLL